jgi:sec-independent protein translocase protein TatB
MLPGIGATEVLLIAVLALIVVGPKDLPMLMRRMGEFMGRLRMMAAEFRASFDEMARQSELDELRKEVEAMRKGQYLDLAAQTEHLDDLQSTVGEIEQSLADVGVQLHPPMSYQYDEAAAPPPQTASIGDAAPPGTVETPKKPRKPRAATTKATATAKAPAAKAPKAKTASATPRRKKAADA